MKYTFSFHIFWINVNNIKDHLDQVVDTEVIMEMDMELHTEVDILVFFFLDINQWHYIDPSSCNPTYPTNQTYNQAPYRPGFWTGLGTGGILGYLFGRPRTYGYGYGMHSAPSTYRYLFIWWKTWLLLGLAGLVVEEDLLVLQQEQQLLMPALEEDKFMYKKVFESWE